MSQSVNTFTELNSDSHPVNTQPNVMTDAINATLTTNGENQLILQNLMGNDWESQLNKGYVPLGVEVFNDIAYIVSGLFDANGDFISGELGTYPSPDWSGLFAQGPNQDPNYFLPLVQQYQPLYNFSTSINPTQLNNDYYYNEPFNTALLDFQPGRLIEVELQPSYDDSINIIFTDDYNPMRLVNSRFRLDDSGKNAALANRRQDKDTNTYSEERFGFTRLIRQASKIPDLNFEGTFTGGILSGGNYKFYFRYIDSDGSLTDVIEESGTVAISYPTYGTTTGDTTDKLVRFRIGNLDRNFSGIKIYYSYSSGDEVETSAIYEIANIYDINEDEIEINVYGTEVISAYDDAVLNLDYSSIDTVRTMTQYNDRLLIGNVTNKTLDYDNFKALAETLMLTEHNIPMKIKELGDGYADPNNVYFNLGYWAGETYELGVVFILKDGQGNTPAFPIRGGDNYNDDFNYTFSTQFQDNGFKGDSSLVPNTENNLGIYRTNKCREGMLFGSDDPAPPTIVPPDGSADSTMVRYFKINIEDIKNDSYIQENTDGFFFVRKERSRDCIVQGYLTPARQRSINGVQITTVSNSFAGQMKFGAPGNYAETPTFPYSNYTLNSTLQNASGNSTRFGFYAPDLLGDGALFNSIFDGSGKGLMYNQEATYYWEDLGADINPGGVVWVGENRDIYGGTQSDPTLPQSGWPNYANPNLDDNYKLDFNYNYSFGGNISTAMIETFPGSNIFTGTQVVDVIDGDWDSPYDIDGFIDNMVFTYTVDVSNPFNVTGTAVIPQTIGTNGFSINDTNIQSFPCVWLSSWGDPVLGQGSATHVLGQWTNGQYGFMAVNIGGMQNTTAQGNTWTVPADTWVFADWYLTQSGQNGIISTSNNTRDYLGATFARNHDFCPVYQAPTASGSSRVNEMQYIGGAIEPISHDQWGNISRVGDWQKLADFVGVDFNEVDSNLIDAFNSSNIYDNALSPVTNFYTVPNNNPGWPSYTGSSRDDFIYKIQQIGFAIGVKTNVYNSTTGALDITGWRNKYNQGSADQQYYAITKRYRWDQIPDPGTIGWEGLDIFGGDCFISYTYKRYAYGLGIDGIPTATDPASYGIDGNGLLNRGYAFPMVCENNYNMALRCKQDKDLVETALYGTERSFWPLGYNDVFQFRSSRQSESYGFNHGFNKELGDRYHIGLNERAPSLNINYGNRVMVSSPAVAGNFFNGYTDFSGLNFRDYNKQFGEITKLITSGDYVYCIFDSGIGVVPINQRTMITEQTGGVFLDDAQVLAQKMQIISTEYGSDQQFSIIKTDSYVYGVDLNKNKVWRITSAGGSHKLELISDFAVQTILNEYKRRVDNNELPILVKTNYDRERNNVIFSYYNEENGLFNTDLYELVEAPDDPNDPDPNDPGGGTDGTGGTLDPDFEVAAARTLTDTKGETLVLGPDDKPVEISQTDSYGKLIPVFWEANQLGSLYWNETLGKWISRLSWNPLFTFNIQGGLFSFSGTKKRSTIWKHFAEEVPYCHVYGDQEKFVFEFMVVDNPSAQKILNNFHLICNRAFPGRITYGLIEDDIDYETFQGIDNGYIELMKQRHEGTVSPNAPFQFPHSSVMPNGDYNDWSVSTDLFGSTAYFTMNATNGDPISEEECERIEGGFIIYNGVYYIIGPVFENNGVFYNEILDQNSINIGGPPPTGWTFDEIDFGIIKQNMEYIEDHLYIEVGKDDTKSRVRDKAIRVRVMYEGYDYVTVQSIISKFVYSFG